MEMERQNKKMQVWNLLAEKIRKLVEESVSNPEELQEIRIRTGQPLLIQMKGQERVLPDPAHPYLVTKEDIGETMGYICHYSLYAYENELKHGGEMINVWQICLFSVIYGINASAHPSTS